MPVTTMLPCTMGHVTSFIHMLMTMQVYITTAKVIFEYLNIRTPSARINLANQAVADPVEVLWTMQKNIDKANALKMWVYGEEQLTPIDEMKILGHLLKGIIITKCMNAELIDPRLTDQPG